MTESWTLLSGLLPAYTIRIGAALLCGILLGIERERKDKPAGLRTIVLITVGSTLYMLVSEIIPLVAKGSETITRVDPARIAAQVVTGVGFLGAGAIIQARGSVHGLTTAAVIWVSAGIGLCIGVGFPVFGIGITLVVLLVLVALDPLSHWLGRRGEVRDLELVAPNDALTLHRMDQVLHQFGASRETIEPEIENDSVRIVVHYVDARPTSRGFLEALSRIEGVRGAEVTDDSH